MPRYSARQLRDKIGALPRVDLIEKPTPLRKLARLSEALGGPELYIKRDDLTGLAFGGNKSRKLEFIVADMLRKKADAVVTWASVQSNWCLQTAAAARLFGIRPVLILFRTSEKPPAIDGNLLLDVVLDADIIIRETGKGRVVKASQAFGHLEEAARELRKAGHSPYLAPVGGSLVLGDMDRPLGAIAYVEAAAELWEQAAGQGFVPDYVVHATGSGGTQAGLVVGARALTDACRVIGVSVSDPRGPFSKDVLEIAAATDEALGLGLGIGPDDVIVDDEYIGSGYGSVDPPAAAVIRRLFQTEGIILDPVYTAKAMAGLIDLVEKGRFTRTDKVVFFHTGGTPALFALREPVLDALGRPFPDRRP